MDLEISCSIGLAERMYTGRYLSTKYCQTCLKPYKSSFTYRKSPSCLKILGIMQLPDLVDLR